MDGLPVFVSHLVLNRMRQSGYLEIIQILLDAWCYDHIDPPYMTREVIFHRGGRDYVLHELTHEDWYVSVYLELRNVEGVLCHEVTSFDIPEWLR